MRKNKKMPAILAAGVLLGGGLLVLRAQEESEQELAVEHAECVFFGPKHDKFVDAGLQATGSAITRTGGASRAALSSITEQVARMLSLAPAGNRASGALSSQERLPGSIDAYIFDDIQAAGINPAEKTSDAEFLRRVTLDLTGRIPTADRVLSFLADTSADKRAKLVDELLKKPEWVDKWTMYFGDLYNNTAALQSSGLRRYPEGRNAFYKYIYDSLASGKPYNQMASELISAQGDNSFDPKQGNLNWILGGIVTGGPQQDIWDQQAANVAEQFLGIAHMNCVLCHNGRGHLDSLSLWGKGTTRSMAWGFSAFLSHSQEDRVPVAQNYYYYRVIDDQRYRADYGLTTTTGNRPARQPIGSVRAVAPNYFFTGDTPAAGENYRVALARLITADPQFARAIVNYIWKEFMGRGIVEPTNQFDPARLDPDNPPPAPWTLQPSNARLLNALAQRFVDNKYDLKALMREIVNSDAYQMSSVYNGEWKTDYEKLFARHFVRRLWSEEIHDAVTQSSGVGANYVIPNFSTKPQYSDLSFGNVQWAMQLPDVVNMPAGSIGAFLDSFLRGNRDDQDRKGEGSLLQALNLMNDSFVMNRVRVQGAGVFNQVILRNLNLSDDKLIDALYLNVLSRYPSAAEKSTALAALKPTASSIRQQRAENLLWSLYNKVDFVFNY